MFFYLSKEMTTYQGGKKRIGKRIHDVIIEVENDLEGYCESCCKCYLEPFVGMGGVIRHFGEDDNREMYGCDINKDLIMMWKELQRGWKPPKKCSKEKYEKLKESKVHSAERGYIGVVCSWGGIFFHAYRLEYERGDKDFMAEGYRGIMNILPYIKSVKFKYSSYEDLNPSNMLIYCDPPYKNNKLGVNKYSFFQNFDHDKFWEKMRKWSKNNIVFISEWKAPRDFKKIWSAKSHVIINQNGTKKYNDNLYVHENIYNKITKNTLRRIKQI